MTGCKSQSICNVSEFMSGCSHKATLMYDVLVCTTRLLPLQHAMHLILHAFQCIYAFAAMHVIHCMQFTLHACHTKYVFVGKNSVFSGSNTAQTTACWALHTGLHANILIHVAAPPRQRLHCTQSADNLACTSSRVYKSTSM